MADLQELESKALDVTDNFKTMDVFEFSDFLHSKSKEPSLKISYGLTGADNEADHMARLKGFLDGAAKYQQKRFVTVTATEEEYNKYGNVFASGAKWEKI